MQPDSEGAKASHAVNRQLIEVVRPLLAQLDARSDKRLVRTFLGLVQVIVVLRHNHHGLLLRELGGYLLGAGHVSAGTKRISNLLRSKRWQHELVDAYLWRQAERRVQGLIAVAAATLVVWDESVIEKSESLALEGLCAARSAKAHRLSQIKPGLYTLPTGKPTFAPGYNWLLAMVLGLAG